MYVYTYTLRQCLLHDKICPWIYNLYNNHYTMSVAVYSIILLFPFDTLGAPTTGQLTTVAFIVCSCATTACWYHKPADAHTPEAIEADVAIEQILRQAKDDAAQKPYTQAHLDFVTRREWAWSYSRR